MKIEEIRGLEDLNRKLWEMRSRFGINEYPDKTPEKNCGNCKFGKETEPEKFTNVRCEKFDWMFPDVGSCKLWEGSK